MSEYLKEKLLDDLSVHDDVFDQLDDVEYYGYIDPKNVDKERPDINVSKAFLVWFLSKHTRDTIDKIKTFIVDEPGDKGIDAVYYTHHTQPVSGHTYCDIYIYQAKFYSYELETKYVKTIKDLVLGLSQGISAFSDADPDTKQLINYILSLKNSYDHTIFHICYVTTSKFNANAQKAWDDLNDLQLNISVKYELYDMFYLREKILR